MGEQVSVQVLACSSSGYVSRSRIAGSYGKSVFNFWRICHTFFPPWSHHFTFPPMVHRGSSFSTSWPIVVFLIIAVLMSMKYPLHLNIIKNNCSEAHGKFGRNLTEREGGNKLDSSCQLSSGFIPPASVYSSGKWGQNRTYFFRLWRGQNEIFRVKHLA